MNKALYNQFIVLLTSRLLQTNTSGIDVQEELGAENNIDSGIDVREELRLMYKI
jgi:hypothetical protein